MTDQFEPIEPIVDEVVHRSWWAHWRPAIIASLLFVSVLAGIVVVREQNKPVVTTTTTIDPALCPPGSPITCLPLSRTVRRGMKGDDVLRIQQRLKDLKFDPGVIDGIYGGDTMMAVWAFQALVLNMSRDTLVDFVTPVLWDSMRGNVVITPRRESDTPNHVEVYLPEQVMIVVKGKDIVLISHVSTGTGQEWCEEVIVDPGEEGNKGADVIKDGICGQAITPGGIYYFYNRKVGQRESKLGTMWNPVYFNYGVAIHGAMMIPKEPASHGCVRIPIFISEYFPSLVDYGDRVYVFDGVKTPEENGSQPPPWDKKDPNYTTTTSSTTTIPKTTTTVPKVMTTVPKVTAPVTTTVAPLPVITTVVPG